VAKTDSDRTAEGLTVKALREQYPDQCREIADDARAATLAEIAGMNVHQIQEQFPDLVKKLSVPIISGMEPKAGFILERDDPYAEGVARDYAKARKCQVQILPAILPWTDPATAVAMRMYLLRARCSGDVKRTNAAVEAVKKYAPKMETDILGK
jgi:hypothetical protein